ncbi:MAG: hypothetical protein L0Y66_16185 [Myxococcaceae bacterium]|nr:hypothetical protein [Myxococcaceae bacterium]MCI0669637.1 hypothetical protein [Myxococcaceae bacterium]
MEDTALERAAPARFDRDDLGDRDSSLGHHEDVALLGDLVEEGEAAGLEVRRSNLSWFTAHGHMTIVT